VVQRSGQSCCIFIYTDADTHPHTHAHTRTHAHAHTHSLVQMLPFLVFCVKALESHVIFSTARYLPWRTQLYVLLCHAYCDLQKHGMAKQVGFAVVLGVILHYYARAPPCLGVHVCMHMCMHVCVCVCLLLLISITPSSN